MEFIGNVLAVGVKVLGATIFFGIVVTLAVFGLLDDAARIFLAVFGFLFIECPRLFAKSLDKLIDRL